MKNKNEIEIKHHIGNIELLKLNKTGFLCSQKIPANIVLKSYDWAIKMRDEGKCVISGFHSKIEKDILHYLLKGKQPIIIALARGLKKEIEPELRKPLKDGRLLIITPFDSSVARVTKETAEIRNCLILQFADVMYIPYVQKDGMLDKILSKVKGINVITTNP